MDSDGKPRRPAPPLPSVAWSKHASYTSLRSSQSSTTIKCNNNGTGKETVIVVQRKTAKKVPSLMRKFKMDKKVIAGSGDTTTSSGSNAGSALASAAAREAVVVRQRTTTTAINDNRRSATTATSVVKNSTQSRNGYQPIQSRPMIIRPGSNHHAKKKKVPPPRPPPPKVSQSQSRTASTKSTSRPPSYDDVLRADLNAFMSESKGPRLKPKAPARPTSVSKQVDLLIDFDAPAVAAPTNPYVERRSSPKSLLDLDITPSADLLTSSAITAAKHIPRHSSYALGGHSKSPWNSGDVRRGDDWLQSCLHDSANGVFDRHGDGFSDFNVASSPPPPPLPPRPRFYPTAATSAPHAGFCDVETCPSPEPPTSAAPPVPPLPFTDASSIFRLENGDDTDVAVPPLPPRPKLLDLSRPCALSLYDYVTAESGDLSFRAGDAITLVYEVDDEWLYGVIDDRGGIFPKNFVDIVVPLSDTSAIKYIGQEVVMDGPRCRAIYDFMGENDGELWFVAGDVISLVERVNEEWFRGKLRGNEGMFPVTFVDVLEDLTPIAGSRRAEQWTTTTKMVTQDPSLVVGARCVAIYDFLGESGELTFSEGDRLEVTGVVNDDWLVGRKLDSCDDDDYGCPQGRFPKNFVERLK